MRAKPDAAYWAGYRAGEIQNLRRANERGLGAWLSISPPKDCPVAALVADERYGENSLPLLPLAGCQRSPGCACCYIIQLPPEDPVTPESLAETEREYEATLAQLPRNVADNIRQVVKQILRGFGINPSDGS